MSNNLATLNPFDIFIGLDGKPLNSGYIYVGVAGQDPELNPVQLYWDTAGTLPATQPLRTLQGYLANAGAPARIAVNGNYSVRVRDKNGQQVYFEPNVLLTSSGGVSGLSDNGGFIAQLITAAGFVGYRIYNQAAARIAEFLHYGSGNAGAYGIAPGMAGINTPAGVDFSLGVNDGNTILRMKDGAGIGINKVPVANAGAVQLQGSAGGGMNVGNVNNTNSGVALDWYERNLAGAPFTPILYVGGLVSDSSISSAVGHYTRIGNLVFFELILQVNIKGVAAGGLAIRGMPYVPISPFNPCPIRAQGVNLVSPGWLFSEVAVAGGVASANLFTQSASGGTTAGDTVLSNGCSFEITGFYRVA